MVSRPKLARAIAMTMMAIAIPAIADVARPERWGTMVMELDDGSGLPFVGDVVPGPVVVGVVLLMERIGTISAVPGGKIAWEMEKLERS